MALCLGAVGGKLDSGWFLFVRGAAGVFAAADDHAGDLRAHPPSGLLAGPAPLLHPAQHPGRTAQGPALAEGQKVHAGTKNTIHLKKKTVTTICDHLDFTTVDFYSMRNLIVINENKI